MEPTIIKFVIDSATNTVRCNHFDVTINCSYNAYDITDISCSENNIFIADNWALYAYDMNGTNTRELQMNGDFRISAVLQGFVYVFVGEANVYHDHCLVYDEELNFIRKIERCNSIIITYKESLLMLNTATRKITDELLSEEVDAPEFIGNLYENDGIQYGYGLWMPRYVDDDYAYFVCDGNVVRKSHSNSELEIIEQGFDDSYFVIKPPLSNGLKFSD